MLRTLICAFVFLLTSSALGQVGSDPFAANPFEPASLLGELAPPLEVDVAPPISFEMKFTFPSENEKRRSTVVDLKRFRGRVVAITFISPYC